MSYRHASGVFADAESIPMHYRENLPGFDFNSHDETRKLARFLNGALGHNLEMPSLYLPVSTVSESFLPRLNSNFNADWFSAKLEECDFGMDIELIFVNEKVRTCDVVAMVWRID
jgi:hypothetical protein